MFTIPPDWGLWGLFISAFLSSTLLPGSSEAILLTLALQNNIAPHALLAVATLGNSLGGMTSWGLGVWLARRSASQKLTGRHAQALTKLQRWGSPLLLLSWLPVIGDPLCLAAGWLRISWYKAVLFIALGKGARYALLLAIV